MYSIAVQRRGVSLGKVMKSVVRVSTSLSVVLLVGCRDEGNCLTDRRSKMIISFIDGGVTESCSDG